MVETELNDLRILWLEAYFFTLSDLSSFYNSLPLHFCLTDLKSFLGVARSTNPSCHHVLTGQEMFPGP